jgi:polynucleotide 5'-hydroxyl-kinase GRC3/NOL9
VTVTAEWQEVAERLAASARRPLVVLVMGAMDTGKSTLCAFLARFLFERGRRVAVVDADLGQSDIGLPTTIGMGFMERPIERLREIACRAAYFVGATSPVGHLLPTVVGTKLMVERALAMGAEVVIVDTDGLVHGGVGWALKHHTFEAVRPTHVVLLQRAGELAHYQHQWQGIVWTEVISVPVPEAVVPKSREMRRAFRQERFREWLQQCREITLPLANLRWRNALLGQGVSVPPTVRHRLSELLGTTVLHAERVGDIALVIVDRPPTVSDFTPAKELLGSVPFLQWRTLDHYEQLVVGLLDFNGELLNLGLSFRWNFAEGTFTLLAPPFEASHLHTVAFGFVRLALDGTELEVVMPGRL